MVATTQRFFMVKVTGCKDCPILAKASSITYCNHGKIWADSYAKKIDLRNQNENSITPTCPMYGQSQEVEK